MPTHRCPKCGALYHSLGGGTCEACHFGQTTRRSNRDLYALCAIAGTILAVLLLWRWLS